MKTFLKNLFLFVLLFLAFAVLIVGAACVYMNSTPFTIDKSKNIIILGDSHTECAIDDTYFKRSVNFSKSATPYLYCYGALRKLIADNPQIDTVLLSYHFSSLMYSRERDWLFDEAQIFTRTPVYMPYLSLSDMKMFAFNSGFYKAVMITPMSGYDYFNHKRKGRDLNWRKDRIGQYLPLPYFKLQDEINARKPYANLNSNEKMSPLQLKYIRKIAEYCKEKGVTLVLINTPVYDWKKYTNYPWYEANRKKYLKDVRFLDYAGFTSRDSNYADISHLNKYGAREFSTYLDTSLARDLKKASMQ